MAAGGDGKPELWREPFVKDGGRLALEEAMALFVDRTGRPGPSTWELSSFGTTSRWPASAGTRRRRLRPSKRGSCAPSSKGGQCAPYQTIVYFPSSNAQFQASIDEDFPTGPSSSERSRPHVSRLPRNAGAQGAAQHRQDTTSVAYRDAVIGDRLKAQRAALLSRGAKDHDSHATRD